MKDWALGVLFTGIVISVIFYAGMLYERSNILSTEPQIDTVYVDVEVELPGDTVFVVGEPIGQPDDFTEQLDSLKQEIQDTEELIKHLASPFKLEHKHITVEVNPMTKTGKFEIQPTSIITTVPTELHTIYVSVPTESWYSSFTVRSLSFAAVLYVTYLVISPFL